MNYTDPTEKTKEALHIADISESFLTFENSEGSDTVMEVFISKEGARVIDVQGYGEMYLTKNQTQYMIKWITYSR